MKVVNGCAIAVQLLLLFSCVIAQQDKILPERNYFRIYQPLDHFDSQNMAKFPQFFDVNESQFYSLTGPVLVYLTPQPISNKGSGFPFWLKLLSTKLRALLVRVPVRFYGNYEEPDSFFQSKNLEYLTIEQMIADTAAFVETLQAEQFMNINSETQFFLFGENFLGSICIWTRAKHPELISGCIARDPLLFAKLEFQELDEAVSNAIEEVDDADSTCMTRIEEIIRNVETVLSSSHKEYFLMRLREFTDEEYSNYDILRMISLKLYHFTESDNAQRLCEIFRTADDYIVNVHDMFSLDPVDTLVDETTHLYSNKPPLFSEIPRRRELRAVNRLRFWQQCTQFGLFETANLSFKVSSPILTAAYFERKCEKIFGRAEDRSFFDYENTNSKFNRNLNNVSNTVIVRHKKSIHTKALQSIPTASIASTTIDCGICRGSGTGIFSGNSPDNEADRVSEHSSIENIVNKIEKSINSWRRDV